jgi:hypothetical protein
MLLSWALVLAALMHRHHIHMVIVAIHTMFGISATYQLAYVGLQHAHTHTHTVQHQDGADHHLSCYIAAAGGADSLACAFTEEFFHCTSCCFILGPASPAGYADDLLLHILGLCCFRVCSMAGRLLGECVAGMCVAVQWRSTWLFVVIPYLGWALQLLAW